MAYDVSQWLIQSARHVITMLLEATSEWLKGNPNMADCLHLNPQLSAKGKPSNEEVQFYRIDHIIPGYHD